MSEKHIFVQYLNGFANPTKQQPFQSTQRIKFTCFDISSKYAVFGASSGGVYVYSREKFIFLKLIPTKEGCINIIHISPDENFIALATSKGIIVVIENFLLENATFFKSFLEHQGNSITCLKWYNNQLYSGDNVGRIAVTVTNNKFSKILFQSPCVSIMELNNSIVQIDVFSKFLLISTHTHTYLCNSEKEQYKQIGIKLRDGTFGACFFYKEYSLEELIETASLSETNTLSTVKIFCARPGLRLWEASFDGTVTFTHQFKNSSYEVPPTTLIHVEENLDSQLKLTKINISSTKNENFNFSKIFPFYNKFIFTYNSDGFYIFDPNSVCLSYWMTNFNDIKEVRLHKNFIYILTVDNFFIISLTTIENLAVNFLILKKYYACAEICSEFMEDLLLEVDNSEKINLLSSLEEKLKNLKKYDLLSKIMPLLERIKNKIIKHKKNPVISGMIVLNSHLVNDKPIESYHENRSKEQNVPENAYLSLPDIENHLNDKIITDTESLKSEAVNYTNDFKKEYVLKILLEQYHINLIRELVELPKYADMILNIRIDDFLMALKHFILDKSQDKRKENNSHSIQKWCQIQYLKWFLIHPEEIYSLNVDSEVFQYLVESIIKNQEKDVLCSCHFPLPVAHTSKTKYYSLGCEIMKKIEKSDKDFFKKVPTLSKYYFLELRRGSSDLISLIPYLLQYSDEELFSYFVDKMSYDHWAESTKMMIKLHSDICLNCEKNFYSSMQKFSLSWTFFGMQMVKSIGGTEAIRLLTIYSNNISSNSLNDFFYQVCIFSSIFDNMHDGLRNRAIDLAYLIQKKNPEKSIKLKESVSRFLNKCNQRLSIATNLKTVNIESRCPSCNLPFNKLIFEETFRLKCGHIYHDFCKNNKDTCQLCK